MWMEQRSERKPEDEINILDLILILLKRRKLIASITLGVAVISAVISLFIPRIYEATARILPPSRQNEGSTAMLLSRLAGSSGFGELLSAGIGGSSDLYVGILKGATVSDAVIDRFKLMDSYRAKAREDARARLANVVKFEGDKKSSIISISVQDKDPQKALEMANAFVEELSRLLQRLAVTNASKKRLFFEDQLKTSHETLAKSEEALSSFQESTGAIKIDEQAKAVLEGIARLQAAVAAKEIELKVMKTYATPYNRDVRRTEEELAGLQDQLNKLESKGADSSSNSLIPTGQLPGLGTQYLRKMREFKFQEALYEILLKQYETARLSEAQDSTMIQVVDPASLPQKAVKPKRRMIVTAAAALAFLIATISVIIFDYVKQFSSLPHNREKVEMVKASLAQIGFRRRGSRKTSIADLEN